MKKRHFIVYYTVSVDKYKHEGEVIASVKTPWINRKKIINLVKEDIIEKTYYTEGDIDASITNVQEVTEEELNHYLK